MVIMATDSVEAEEGLYESYDPLITLLDRDHRKAMA